MGVEFDPKAKAVNTGAENQPNIDAAAPAQSQSLDNYDPYFYPERVVSEMDLLFSGTRNLKQFRAEHPLDPIGIPGLDNDILGVAPILGSTSKDMSEVIQNYQALRKNLIERRNNFSHALEGDLMPAEAMDIQQRIEQIDTALIRVDQELDKSTRRKQQLENYERVQGQKKLEAEQAAEEKAKKEWEKWNKEGN